MSKYRNIVTDFIPDMPQGPLDEYRKRAKFDWKKLRVYIEGEDNLKVKYMIWNRLENDPMFKRTLTTLPSDEQKRIAAMQVNRVAEKQFLPAEIHTAKLVKKMTFMMSQNEALHAICMSLSVKMALGVGLFTNAVNSMGTERHQSIFQAAWNREIVTCLAITEISHGSNTKCIRTTAIYDPKTKEFIINTPDFQAAKCWVGNLGKTASMALLFAILYTPDGHNHGLHGFLVPIRDPKTLKAFPNVIVGDIGEKIGLNGIDNGFVMFQNYRIPKYLLLNRTADVLDDGTYESVFSEPAKMLGAALESFSAGRVGIMHEAANTISQAVVIAVRYAAIRKQFGTERNGPESPIIEYQLHQWRIFPYLATACVLKVAVYTLSHAYLSTVEKSQADSNGFELLTQIVSEIHALVSSSKAMFTWITRDAIQEARECCGGHGYLKASNIGELRNNHDATTTYEGDNNVLGQQGSNWLLRQWNGKIESPLGSVNFLAQRDQILKTYSFENFNQTMKNNLISFDFVLSSYEWLMCYLLDVTGNQINNAKANGVDSFKAKNDAQVYKARTLSQALAEYYAMCSFKKKYLDEETSSELKPVLLNIFLIYGFWNLDKHLATFYMGGFAQGPKLSEFIRTTLLNACADIKDSSVAIADSLAPPDWVLNSVIGKSDGKLYDNLKEVVMNNPGAMDIPKWANDVILKKPTQSKL
ncbi:unnamed protein product [Diamesa hyperborea]